jgi:uncharacterized damage-inducible protein DinB
MTTMTDREMIAHNLEQEIQTTLKLLKEFPENKLDLKPSDKLRTAREIAWVLVSDIKALSIATQGEIFVPDAPPPPLPPRSMKEIIGALEAVCNEVLSRLKGMSEGKFQQKTVKFPVGPKQMADIHLDQMGWVTVKDHIHHRGQFSVYLRMAGGKVPSIYGPSADEPWM